MPKLRRWFCLCDGKPMGVSTDRYASLAPKRPDKVAQCLADELGVPVAIVDANDLGVEVLGASRGVDPALVAELFGDNPLGQGSQQTPLCILRRQG